MNRFRDQIQGMLLTKFSLEFLSFRLLSKNLQIKIYKATTLFAILYVYEAWSFFLKTQSEGV